MDITFDKQASALKGFFEALQTLYDVNILTNKKDFTGQLGEWFVATIYNGKRAVSGINKGWDVVVSGKYIQVKTHSKAKTNSATFSAISKNPKGAIDELVIIDFSATYKINAFYQVPWEIAVGFITTRGKLQPRDELKWSSIQSYKVDLNKLPRQEVISLFI